MTALATPPTLFDDLLGERVRARDAVAGGESVGPEPIGGEQTLDALLADRWEGLTAHRVVPCPVCGGEMEPEYGVHALPTGGRCTSCGTSLR